MHQPPHKVRRRCGSVDAIQSSTDERRQDRIHVVHYAASDTTTTCMPARYQSMASTHFRLCQLAISACTSTQTSVYADTLTSSLLVVMQHCANFVPFVGIRVTAGYAILGDVSGAVAARLF
jgi:hypothetical protein